jgi:hypothetical protein
MPAEADLHEQLVVVTRLSYSALPLLEFQRLAPARPPAAA